MLTYLHGKEFPHSSALSFQGVSKGRRGILCILTSLEELGWRRKGFTSTKSTWMKQILLWGEVLRHPHSSTLPWKIRWMEEPGGLQSMGSLRVGHDSATSLSLFTFMHWRRKWQPTPVFLPGESQGWWSLVGCCLWGRTESDTTEVT